MDGSELPPDPYVALGVSKDADDNAIKSAYRKLVLKWHPDKIADPAEKEKGADRFHLIQTAYERLSNPSARKRYDLEVELLEAKKARATQRGVSDAYARTQFRSPSYEATRPSHERRASERVAPIYEERRPAYADFADVPPKMSRKDSEYGRSSRRQAPEAKEKVRTQAKDSKEAERVERREKARRATKDTRRDRESKYSRPYVEGGSDESDVYVHEVRRPREDRDDRRREERRRTDEQYAEPSRRQPPDADINSYFDERTRKTSAQAESARDFGGRSARTREASDPRPMSSHRDFDYDQGPKGESRPTYLYRRSSVRRQPSTREYESSPRSAPRERDRYSSAEEGPRYRPAPLNQSRSSPADIRIPAEKPRSYSLQHDTAPFEPAPIKRSETMPVNGSRSRYEKSHRDPDILEDLVSPNISDYHEPTSSRYSYGMQYAEDREYPTVSGMRMSEPYQTEVREPPRESRRKDTREARPTMSRRVTRSPSPIRELRQPRESQFRRSSTIRHAERPSPSPLLTRSMSQRYEKRSGSGENVASRSRPSTVRESSYRSESPLYAEIRPDDHYSSGRADGLRSPSGNSPRRPDVERPYVSRSGSSAIYAR